jgi:hypothetical protein
MGSLLFFGFRWFAGVFIHNQGVFLLDLLLMFLYEVALPDDNATPLIMFCFSDRAQVRQIYPVKGGRSAFQKPCYSSIRLAHPG